MRKFVAEALGTFILVFLGTGAAVLGGGADNIVGYGAIGLAFGLAVVIAAYTVGSVSGAHLNPAVSLAFWMNKRITAQECGTFVAGQVVGAFLGSGLLAFVTGSTAALGQNIVQEGYSLATGGIIELVLTFLLVLVVLSVTSETKGHPQIAGAIIGLTLLAGHFVGVPVSSMSVNPARSLAPAVLAGGQAMSQLWLFMIWPMVGGALAAVTHRTLIEAE
ncbi:TPA: MIP/aquaporin family protein [Streptococcus suis]